jgi:hypothetical protein
VFYLEVRGNVQGLEALWEGKTSVSIATVSVQLSGRPAGIINGTTANHSSRGQVQRGLGDALGTWGGPSWRGSFANQSNLVTSFLQLEKHRFTHRPIQYTITSLENPSFSLTDFQHTMCQNGALPCFRFFSLQHSPNRPASHMTSALVSTLLSSWRSFCTHSRLDWKLI